MLQTLPSRRAFTGSAAFLTFGVALMLAVPWRLTAQQAVSTDKQVATAPAAQPSAPKKARKSASRAAKPVPAAPAKPVIAPSPVALPKSADNAPAIAAGPLSAETVPAQRSIAVPKPLSADSTAPAQALPTSGEPISADGVPLAPAVRIPDTAQSPVAIAPSVALPRRATAAARSVPQKPRTPRAETVAPLSVTGVVQTIEPSIATTARVTVPLEPVSATTVTRLRAPVAVQTTPTTASPRISVATAQKPASLSFAARRMKPIQSVDLVYESDKVISLDLEQSTCLSALKRVFKHFGADYRIDQDASSIVSRATLTLHLTKAPLHKALEMILQSTRSKGAPLSYRVENGVYIILPAAAAITPAEASKAYENGVPSMISKPGSGSGPATIQNVGRVDLIDADIRTALKMLFDQVGGSYSIDDNVHNRVTLRLTGKSLTTVLDCLCRAAQMTYKVDAGVYRFAAK